MENKNSVNKSRGAGFVRYNSTCIITKLSRHSSMDIYYSIFMIITHVIISFKLSLMLPQPLAWPPFCLFSSTLRSPSLLDRNSLCVKPKPCCHARVVWMVCSNRILIVCLCRRVMPQSLDLSLVHYPQTMRQFSGLWHNRTWFRPCPVRPFLEPHYIEFVDRSRVMLYLHVTTIRVDTCQGLEL
jgi:hypothetical protein